MGKTYELTGGDIDDIIKNIVEDNEDIKRWCDEDERVKSALVGILVDDDIQNEKDSHQNNEDSHQNNEQQFYGLGKRAGLYVRDTDIHICVKDIALEFIKIIFSPDTWEVARDIYCAQTGVKEFNAGAMIKLIARIKDAITDNIIKLTEEKFCFYLQIITHFRERDSFNVEEILEWLPEVGEECSWCLTISECGFRNESQCLLKSGENYEKTVRDMLDDMIRIGILKDNQETGYKINF